MSIKRILYCTKFRDLSLQALKELFVLKKVGLEEIILLHIIPREDVSYVFPFWLFRGRSQSIEGRG
jgi:hypothetical protein